MDARYIYAQDRNVSCSYNESEPVTGPTNADQLVNQHGNFFLNFSGEADAFVELQPVPMTQYAQNA